MEAFASCHRGFWEVVQLTVIIETYLNKLSLQNRANMDGMKAHQDPQLLIDVENTLKSILPYISSLDMEDAVKWLIGCDRYVRDKKGSKWKYLTFTFTRGDIIYVELFGHLGHEFTYAHPAVVLGNGVGWVLIAPTSTKIYSDGNGYHVDLEQADGVAQNCGVMIENIRTVSKQRIIKKFTKMTNTKKLDMIDDKIIRFFTPQVRIKINELIIENHELKKIIIQNYDEIARLGAEIQTLTRQQAL